MSRLGKIRSRDISEVGKCPGTEKSGIGICLR